MLTTENCIYITRIKRHFSCGHNIGTDNRLQLALRAINELDISTLSADLYSLHRSEANRHFAKEKR